MDILRKQETPSEQKERERRAEIMRQIEVTKMAIAEAEKKLKEFSEKKDHANKKVQEGRVEVLENQLSVLNSQLTPSQPAGILNRSIKRTETYLRDKQNKKEEKK